MKNRICIFLVSIMLAQLATNVFASTPDIIEIESHETSVSADQTIKFNAVVKDSSGNPINEDIIWSSSEGSIDQYGLFIPGKSGQTTITASAGNINSSTSIEVVPGIPSDIVTFINSTEITVDQYVELNAKLVDRAGNFVDGDLTWRCQNGLIDYENNTWKPDRIGNAVMRVIYFELESRISFNISAGNPASIQIPYGLTVQSGDTLHVMPTAYDTYGNLVDITRAGELTWSVENGTISQTGVFFGSALGFWNVSVTSTSGVIGSGFIHVLPAQATGLSIDINTNETRTGSPIILSAIKSDILGNSGIVNLPLLNWSVPTGSLTMQNESIIWTPTKVGSWTISVSDEGFSATLQVDVAFGIISEIDILFSEDIIKSGDSVIASITAYDTAGNQRYVDGVWTVDDDLITENKDDWILIRPGEVGDYSISANWFDNETQVTHSVERILNVVPGELAKIILPDSGTKIQSDGVLDLQPIFEDEYGNLLDDILVTWIVDGVDMTMEIRLAGNKWAPNAIGMHEIRATARGVFAITDIEVIPGNARYLNIHPDDGITVKSGERFEITLTSLDVHGNEALAIDVDFDFEDPQGIISPSSQGDGFWIIEGGKTGDWNLRMKTGFAILDVTVSVEDGDPVRLLAEIPDNNPSEGKAMIIRVYSIDSAGNIVPVIPDEVEIRCTAGNARHISDDTFEITLDESGQSESCTIKWNNLVAQSFFDVDPVLFGGGLGNSNTALTLVSIIIFLFIAIMVVLIRRIKSQQSEDYYWDEEDQEEDDENEESKGIESDLGKEPQDDKPNSEAENEDSTMGNNLNEVESTENLRAKLAARAKKTGVMQAAPGTEQGKTGWYIDSSGELTSWLVSDDGTWTRIS